MAEDEEKKWFKIIVPRVLRAILWGFIMGGEVLLLLNLTSFGEIEALIPGLREELSAFILVSVIFEVAIQLLSGTIFRYVLSATRTIVFMGLLVLFTNGGVIASTFPQIGGIQVTVDFKPLLAVLLSLSVLNIAKSILQAVDFLSQKTMEPLTSAEGA